MHFMLFFRGKEEKGLFDVNLAASPILEIGFYRGLSLLYARVGRHIVCEPDVAANDGVMPNAYPSQDKGCNLQFLSLQIVHCLRFALSLNKIGCTSTMKTKIVFVLHCLRFALSLNKF